ncbi:MAG: VWA domain-containing protein [Acidobacteria bacterium]|nr:VWA domain-containing protein [Acidobacteriota bacterium]
MYRICALFACLLPAAVWAQETFRTTVNVVAAPTTVLDRQGNFVSGLKPSDFRLVDKGVAQDIRVDESYLPISLVVAIQADGAVDSVLPRIQKIGPMLKPLVFGEHGEAAIVSFDHRIQVLQDFTNDPDRLAEGLKKLRAGSSSSRLIDAVDESVRMLRRRSGERRRVILLISESRDKGSSGRVRETLAAAEFQNVSLYAVNIPRLLTAFTQKAPAPRPDPFPATAHRLPAGAAVTPDATSGNRNYGNVMPAFEEIIRGVKAIFISNPVEVFTKYTGGKEQNFVGLKGLEEAISAVGSELHAQYLVTYTPSNRLEGGYHEITVTVNRPGLTVRTRPGYWMAAVPQ